MIHSLKQKFLIGLAFAAVALALPAADLKSPTDGKKAGPTTLTGRVVFVDKSLRAVAIEVRGKVLQINVLSRVQVAKGGKVVGFEELAAGQEVTLSFREGPDGRLEVVSLSIDASADGTEAAGKAKTPDPGKGKAYGTLADPPYKWDHGNPATLGAVRLFTCTDTRPDRCTGGTQIGGNKCVAGTNPGASCSTESDCLNGGVCMPGPGKNTTCSVSQQPTDPFPTDDAFPLDTVATLTQSPEAVGVSQALA